MENGIPKEWERRALGWTGECKSMLHGTGQLETAGLLGELGRRAPHGL